MSSPAAAIQETDSGNCIAAPAVASNVSASIAAITAAPPATPAETARIVESPRTKTSAAAPVAGSAIRIVSQGTLSMEEEPEDEVSEERDGARRHGAAREAEH